jgi:uncharacterized protein (TIGR03437 family)
VPPGRFYFSIFSLFTVNCLSAQFANITAPGDGANLYYVINLPSPGFQIPPASSSIYKIGSGPATLFLSFPPPLLPPSPPGFGSLPYLTDYYLVSHPQFSRDGSVFAYTGKRICLFNSSCASVQLYQTVVQGVPGQETLRISGIGWLSGNGRYFLRQEGFPIDTLSLLDLQTGTSQLVSSILGTSDRGSGRLVADDGTAVFTEGGVYREGKLINAPLNASEAVIDAAGGIVLYASRPLGSAPSILHSYRLGEGLDTILVRDQVDIHALAVSADGQRAMFLSSGPVGANSPLRQPQLYTINTDGSMFFPITDEASGVLQYAMSDGGRVAWYLTGDRVWIKLDLYKSSTVFHIAAVDLSKTIVPGSAVVLGGSDLTDSYQAGEGTPLPTELGGVRVMVGGNPAPLISISPASIVFQTPWETPTGHGVNIQVTTHAHTGVEATAQGLVMPLLTDPALLADPISTGGRAIHEDWSGFITPQKPARIGEIVHFYGTGFGAVQPFVLTGVSAPANPPAALATPLSCNMPVLYAGLAPGLVGYYQIDVQVEPEVTSPANPGDAPLRCGGEVIAMIPFS